MGEASQYVLLRKLLKALGLSEERAEELIALIQSWLAGEKDGQQEIRFPYFLRDDFLSAAELEFYQVLKTATADWAVVFTKVSLGDLFYASTGDHATNQAYRNRIDRKHLDFLLCEPGSVRPLLGVELDDRSHRRADRQRRDMFVDGVFRAAGLPLVHVPVRVGYSPAKLNEFLRQHLAHAPSSPLTETLAESSELATDPQVPDCPTCGRPMVLRTSRRGPNAGQQFWGCSNFPNCRGVLQLATDGG